MTHQEFQALVARKLVLLDGATGTELIKQGMPAGVCPEAWCVEHPEAVQAVQRAYFQAGSQIVYAPTFGANPLKLAEFGLAERCFELNKRLMEISREAAAGDAHRLVFGDLAPTGKFIHPVGDLDFEAAVDCYKAQVAGLLAGGADGFVIETILDLQEARAALIAVQESSPDLPVMVTMTFEASGRTLSGTDPVAALVTLQSLGADAFGCNCSTGPAEMRKIIAQLKPFAQIPLIAKPNAGVPVFREGRTVFPMDAASFAGEMKLLAEAGANLLGGCCGTTPEHLQASATALSNVVPCPVAAALENRSLVCSSRRTVSLAGDGAFALIGERINPTGKKLLQAELRAGSMKKVFEFALEQTEQGAALLDVNVGLSGIDETAMMRKAIETVTQASELPLVVDSTVPETVETALRRYPGRALLNSISAERERLEKILPIAVRYGAMLILLPVTDAGLPKNVEERKATVETILRQVEALGYSHNDVVVDALVMTVSASPTAAAETLEFLRWIKGTLHCASTCGLSNVSFGMPERKLVNRTFLAMAMGCGLSSAIANPAAEGIVETIFSGDVLSGKDSKMSRFLARYAESGAQGSAASTAAAVPGEKLSPGEVLYRAVLRGDSEGIVDHCRQGLEQQLAPGVMVSEFLIPAIAEVGKRFEEKRYYLPQLIMSADAMRTAMDFLEPLLETANDATQRRAVKPRIILATVRGDIHDIGKNIVKIMLKNYGFEVLDLGKDVAAETILDTAEQEAVAVIGLSALMTTTMNEMRVVIEMAKQRKLKNLCFIVGGAVVDAEFAHSIGAHYAADALDTVHLAQDFLREAGSKA